MSEAETETSQENPHSTPLDSTRVLTRPGFGLKSVHRDLFIAQICLMKQKRLTDLQWMNLASYRPTKKIKIASNKTKILKDLPKTFQIPSPSDQIRFDPISGLAQLESARIWSLFRRRCVGYYEKIRQKKSREASHAAAKKIKTFRPDWVKFLVLIVLMRSIALCNKWLNSSRGRKDDTLCVTSDSEKKWIKSVFLLSFLLK